MPLTIPLSALGSNDETCPPDSVVPSPAPCRHIVDEQRLAFVLEGSQAGYWDWDVASGRVEVNRRWRELRGLPQDDAGAIGLETWTGTMNPADLAETQAALERHLSGAEASYQAEYRIRRVDGSLLWVSDRGKVVTRDADGRPTRVCGVNTDIDLYRRTAEELAEKHRMLSAVQALQREFIRTHDLRAQAERMLALALETSGAGYGFIAEVRRDPHTDAPYLKTHAMTNIAWDAVTQALYEEHLAKGLEFRNLDTLFGYTLRTGQLVLTNNPSQDPRRSGIPGGHPPMNSYMGIPIFSGARMVGMLALANGPGGFHESLATRLEPLLSTFAVMLQAQAVERERTQAILKATDAESRLRRITDGVPGAVFQCSASGGRVRRIGFLSDGVMQLLGVSAAALMQRPRRLLKQVDPVDRRVLWKMLVTSARSGLPWALEFRVNRPGGEPRWLKMAAQCLHLGEGEFEWNGMLLDVSAQKRDEQALREAKDAADGANRAKSSFLAAMSHEIRTPMHALLGFLELLADSRLDPAQADKVRLVRDAGESLLALIDDILDFSRVEAGRVEIHPRPVDLVPLLRRKQEVWTEAALRKGLELCLQIDPAAAGRYLLDDLRLRQVLSNLLSNAIKFTDRGRVSLSLRCQPGSDGARLLFEVSDTGIGVSPEAQSRVFNAFEQADGDTTRRFGGSGLGLSISRRLAELMGGSLKMYSVPGRGTRMELCLPARPVAAPAVSTDPDAPSLPSLPAGMRLLIAEDHAVNRVLMTRQLERLGMQADLAEDGAEALERWQAGHYDLLITDCHMPRMDGFELARQVRQIEARQPGCRAIPILACTADALPETVAACTQAGMNDFIAKPVSLAVLAAKLAAHLPPPAPGVIDGSTLEALTGGDRELKSLALQLFVEALPNDLVALEVALRSGDDGEIRRQCHRMIGLAGTVGAVGLVQPLEALQALAREGRADGRAEARSRVRAGADRAAARALQMLAA